MDKTQPPPYQPAKVQAKERKDELMDRKAAMQEAMGILIGNAQKEVVETFLRTTETEDIEKEYRGLLAAAKTLGTIDPEIRAGLDLCRRVISDMAQNLHINKKRTKQVRKRLEGIVHLVKNWDNIEDKEKHIEALEKAIEGLR